MEVARSSNGGKLNPWAEPFVPGSWGRAVEVEDFSPEWWRLIASSPDFRDGWLRGYDDGIDLLDAGDLDDGNGVLFSPSPAPHGVGKTMKDEVAGKKGGGEVAPLGIEKWWRTHVAPPEVPRYAEKAPKRVVGGGGGGARVSPRPIQQPR